MDFDSTEDRGADGSPAVRATSLKAMVLAAQRLPAPAAGAFERRLPPDVAARIESAVATDWLPLEVQMEVIEALWAVLGERRYREYSTELMLEHTRLPLLSASVATAIRLLGATPNGLLKWVPRAWSTVFRGYGTIEHEPCAPDRARLTLRGLPQRYATSRPAASGLVGTFAGFLRLCNVVGAVTLNDEGAARGVLVYELDWGRAAPG
jgi:hypothetical protein